MADWDIEDIEEYKHTAPEFYHKLKAINNDLTNTERVNDVGRLISIANDAVINTFRRLDISQMYDDHIKYIGNESPEKISKEDFRNFAGIGYDMYLDERDGVQAEEHPDAQRPIGGRRKRSSKTRRSMRKGNKKKRVKTRRRK